MRSHAKAPSAAPTAGRRTALALAALLTLALTLGVSVANALAPTVTVENASEVGYTTAKVKGTVDRQEQSTTYRFQYVTQATFEAEGFDNPSTGVEATLEDGGPGAQDVEGTLEYLSPNTTYHLRLYAENADGSNVAVASSTFETKEVAKPTAVLDPVTEIGGDSASLSGEVDPNDPEPLDPDPAFNSTCAFEYISTSDYGARDEVQRLPVKASSGSFTLEFQSQITDSIAYNANAATVQGALESLSNLDPGEVLVSGGPGNLGGTNPYVFTFPDSNPPDLWADPAALTGPGKAIASTVTNGYNGQDELQRLTINATAGTYSLSYDAQATSPIAFDADAATVQGALEALPGIGIGNVLVSGGPGGSAPFQITFTAELADTNVKQITAGQVGLTATGEAEVRTTTQGREAGFEGATSVPCDIDPVTGSAQSVEAELSGLEPGIAYRVRLRAENLAGVIFSTEESFTTPGLASTAITHLVANLLSDSARLTGFVDPQNELTSYFFEWGKAPNLSDAQSLPASEDASAGSGGQQVAVGENLTNLASETTYYYRLVTDNPTGPPSVGEIESFTTRETPPPMGNGVGAFGDRVIEHVNAPNTNGNGVHSGRMSLDGNRVLYKIQGGTTHAAAGIYSYMIAERTPSGWVRRSAQPPRAALLNPNYALLNFFAATPDLSRVLFRSRPVPGESFNDVNFFTFSPFSGEVEWQALHGIVEATGGYIGPDDLSHHFGRPLNGPISPNDPSTVGGLYDFAVDPPLLVGLLPDESAPTCGVREGEYPVDGKTNKGENWASADGRRVYFISRGSGDCDANPPQLYLREAGPSGSFGADSGAVTVEIGPIFPLGGSGGEVPFLGATSDGSVVFYRTPAALDPDDADETDDVYRHKIGVGNECITCLVPEVNPQSSRPSVDGSHLYFKSSKALAPGALPGRTNLYVWRDERPGEVEFIASTGSAGTYGAVPFTTTPDGSTLIFESTYDTTTGPDLDALTGNDIDVGGRPVYRYSETERSLTCVNCLPGGSARMASGLNFDISPMPHTQLTDDGRTFAFVSGEALVSADVNDAVDLYEWRLGRIGLISDGVSPDGVSPSGVVQEKNAELLGGISASGRDLVFKSPAELAPGVSETGTQLYDARIGGGFPQEAPPAPCAGDGCHGAPTLPPVPTAAGSAQFAGPGNQPPKPRCAKGKVRKRGNCVKAKKRKGQQAKKNAKKRSPSKANSNRGGGK